VPEPTEATIRVIRALFPAAARDEVLALLEAECGVNLPLTDRWGEAQFERLWLAVLKLSNGRVDALRDAIRHAQRDWRDVLVASGFGQSLDAHQEWAKALTL
jgi:hypothetical protein